MSRELSPPQKHNGRSEVLLIAPQRTCLSVVFQQGFSIIVCYFQYAFQSFSRTIIIKDSKQNYQINR